MGRVENVEIFEDSMAMMRNHPHLRTAVEDSILAQEVVAEGDSVPFGGSRDEKMAEIVVSQTHPSRKRVNSTWPDFGKIYTDE